MAYLIEHLECSCHDQTLHPCATVEDVAGYFWGREVFHHLVWAGECPYQFFATDVRLIQALLEDVPVARVRPFLPCSFWVGSKILVVIGWIDLEQRPLLREISYMDWLDTWALPSGRARKAHNAHAL